MNKEDTQKFIASNVGYTATLLILAVTLYLQAIGKFENENYKRILPVIIVIGSVSFVVCLWSMWSITKKLNKDQQQKYVVAYIIPNSIMGICLFLAIHNKNKLKKMHKNAFYIVAALLAVGMIVATGLNWYYINKSYEEDTSVQQEGQHEGHWDNPEQAQAWTELMESIDQLDKEILDIQETKPNIETK